jgi:uncharacterized Zn-finger protein
MPKLAEIAFCKPLKGDHNALVVCATNRHTGLYHYNDRDIRDGSSRMTEYRMQAECRNDEGVARINILVRKFKCIGASPPQDHPHIWLEMGTENAISCPYCATVFRFGQREVERS